MEFPPIYILSLKAAPRYEPLARTLDTHGLAYDVFWGIDGRNGLPAAYEHQIDRAGALARMGRSMSDGEFACALSHRQIYAQIAERDAPSAVILEDDAELSGAFFGLGKALQRVSCDLLLFDHKNTYVRRRDRILLDRGIRAYPMMLPPFLATGYMVSREFAAHLAFRDGPVRQPSDWPDAIMQFDSYACDPRLVSQRADARTSSSLEAARQQHKHKHRKSLRRIFYKAYWRRWMSKRLAYKLA